MFRTIKSWLAPKSAAPARTTRLGVESINGGTEWDVGYVFVNQWGVDGIDERRNY